MNEKRLKIKCSKCQTKMVFTRKITPPAENSPFVGLIYRCPTRKGEYGCGSEKEFVLNIETNKIINN